MKKKFDAVSWMRKKRELIDKEDSELTWEEKEQKTHSVVANDPLWQKLKTRVARKSAVELLDKGSDLGFTAQRRDEFHR